MNIPNWLKQTFNTEKIEKEKLREELGKLEYNYAKKSKEDEKYFESILSYWVSQNNIHSFDSEFVYLKTNKKSYKSTYIPRKIGNKKDTEILKTAFKNSMNVLLVGETGTGKTHAVYNVANSIDKNVIRVNFDKSATPEDLIGEYQPNGIAGKFVWNNGVLINAMEEGKIFVADEINAGTPEVMFYLNSILDEDKSITLKQHNGEIIKAHKDFCFVATMNPETYTGVNKMNTALLDRFDVVLFYDYDEKIEKTLGIASDLIKFAKKIRKSYSMGQVSMPISTRGLLQYVNNKKLFGDNAAKEMLCAKFPVTERSAIEEVFDLINSGDKE